MPQLVLFQNGNMHFALPRDDIRRIRSTTAGFSSGPGRVQCQTLAHEGCSLTLIDLAATLDQGSERPYPSDLKIIMLKTEPSFGLLADQVHGALDVDIQQMDVLPPVFTGKARTCFPRIVRLDNHLALVIDAATLPELFPDGRQPANTLPSGRAWAENRPSAAQGEAGGDRMQQEKKRLDAWDLEALIARKLDDMVGRRVQRLLAQAVAEAVEQCEEGI